MADSKISALTELTTVDGTADFLAIVDADEPTTAKTKKVLPANLPISTAAQTAIDAKLDENITEVDVTSDYTLILSNKDKFLSLRKGTAGVLTIPTNASVAFPVGTQISGMQTDVGQFTFTPDSGVVVQCYNSRNKTTGQYAGWTLVKRSTNTWWLEGNLTT